MANNKDFKVKNGIQPTVYHEGLGTVTSGVSVSGYDLSVAAFDSVTASISQVGDERGLRFSTDGTKFYVLDGNSPQSVYQYNLSTAWDLSTSSYSNNSFNVSSQETQPSGVAFKSDGTKMYIIGYTGDDVNEYTLSTAWDVSTASYSQNYSVSSQTTLPTDIYFKPDGTSFYVSGSSTRTVYQYDLTTAWDISTASYTNNSIAVSERDGLAFNSDGTAFYVVGNSTDTVYEYSLTTAWDLSTASASGQSFSVNAQDTIPYGIDFKSDGTKMYIMGLIGTDVNQYSTGTSQTTATLDLSTGSVFEITPTSDIQIGLSNPADSGTVSQATLLLDGAAGTTYDFSVLATTNKTLTVSSQDVTEEGLYINPDGTELYMLGDAADSVFQYTMTTAWDLSTASYTQSFSGASQDGGMQGVSFKTDGTKMYMLGRSNDNLYQYSLSTAWDISTASYDSVSLNVTSQDTNPYNLHFKPDGTKLYIVGNTNNRIYQYSLSTAWDLSTASYDSVSYTTTSQDGTPKDIYIKSDGTKLYLLGRGNHKIFVYTMSTAWDLSTITYDSVSYPSSGNLETYDNSSTAFYISDDGVYFYLVGNSTGDIEQFYIAGAATITYDSTLQFGGGTAPDSPAIGETDVLTFSTRDGGTTYQAAIAIDGAA